MGYEVHITRKAMWVEDEGPIISLKEWMEYVSSDPEMRADGYAEALTPDGVIRIEDPSIAGLRFPVTGSTEIWHGSGTSETIYRSRILTKRFWQRCIRSRRR